MMQAFVYACMYAHVCMYVWMHACEKHLQSELARSLVHDDGSVDIIARVLDAPRVLVVHVLEHLRGPDFAHVVPAVRVCVCGCVYTCVRAYACVHC